MKRFDQYLLDQSLTEAGDLEVFSQVSAVQLLSSFEQFKGPWLGTAVDFLERAATQIQAAVQLEFRVCKGDEENQTLLKDQSFHTS